MDEYNLSIFLSPLQTTFHSWQCLIPSRRGTYLHLLFACMFLLFLLALLMCLVSILPCTPETFASFPRFGISVVSKLQLADLSGEQLPFRILCSRISTVRRYVSQKSFATTLSEQYLLQRHGEVNKAIYWQSLSDELETTVIFIKGPFKINPSFIFLRAYLNSFHIEKRSELMFLILCSKVVLCCFCC